MATSTWSYRRSTNMSSGDRGNDAALKSKLEQARQQRTAFYRRLADAGARGQTDDDDGKDVEIDLETSTRRQRQRMDSASPHADVVSSVSSTQSSFVEQLPEPRSRCIYYFTCRIHLLVTFAQPSKATLTIIIHSVNT